MLLLIINTGHLFTVASVILLQISVWDAEGWEKLFSRYVQIPDWEEPVKMLPCSYTRLQFYPDEKRFLAAQVMQLAIYEAEGLDCVKQVHSLSFSLQSCAFAYASTIMFIDYFG